MKRILLLACICLVALTSSFAQIIQSESKTTQTIYVEKPKKVQKGSYQGELNIGYATPRTVFAETVHGYRFNKYLFVGAGVGSHGFVNLNIYDVYNNSVRSGGEWRFPIFGNVKSFLPVGEKSELFLNLSVGYGLSLGYGNGLYSDFGAGVRLNKFTIGLGWQHNTMEYRCGYWSSSYRFYRDEIYNQNSFYLKLGFCW